MGPLNLRTRTTIIKNHSTMKNIIKNWLKGGTLLAASLAVFAACSDDHFDVAVNGNSDQTLWQNIKADPNLSEFADLMSRITLMKSENDRSAVLKFNELLDQNQSFTLVAPVNGSFDYKAWSDTIAKANLLRENEETERQGRNLMYLASNQFAMNHVARFAHNLEENRTVHLLNGKNVQTTPGFFNEVSMTGDKLVGSNGSLYKLAGINPFAYNLYDYLAFDPDLSDLNAYIKDPAIDKETFSESMSIPGSINEEGEMVYIDSIYLHRNELLDNLGVNIMDEDSCYVAILPSNQAWDEAKAKLEGLYHYADKYDFNWDQDNNRFNNSNERGNALVINGDSISKAKANDAIITNMFFQPYRMGFESKKDRAIIEYMQTADSIISSRRTIFYNAAAVPGERNQHTNPVFQGAEIIDASNGYVVKLPHYTFDPAYVWVENINFQPSRRSTYYTTNTANMTTSAGETINLTSTNYNQKTPVIGDNGEVVRDENGEIVYKGVGGTVDDNMYQRYEVNSASTKATVDFRLPEVLCAEYTIQLVLAPSNINFNSYDGDDENFYENLCFTAEVVNDQNKTIGTPSLISYAPHDYVNDPKFADNKDAAKMTDDDASNKKGATIIPEMKDVTTVTLFEKIKFDKCYKDVPTTTGETFPRLRLTITSGGRRKIAYAPLNIVKVICKPYRGGVAE